MGTYSLFQSGPAMPAASTSYTGNFIAGVQYQVIQGGCWLEGYFVWVPATNGVTAPTKFALWNVTSGAPAGTVIPGSVVTSGTLTAGQWNYVALSSPVQVPFGLTLIAAAGINPTTGLGFTSLNNQFGSGNPYSAGVTNGPVMAYSDTGGSNPSPWGIAQGVFTTAGSDPSVTMPAGGSNSANFGVDVLISTTPPSGYSGSYLHWANAYGVNPQTTTDSQLNYTIGTEEWLSAAYQYHTCDNLWYYSPPGATELATEAVVWSVATGLAVVTISSPTWLTRAGGAGSAGGGWLKAAFPGGTTIPPGKYRSSVYCANGTSGVFGAKDASTSYWATGLGASGIISGPKTAPSLAQASQCWEYNASDSGATPPYSNGTQEPGQCPFGQLPGGGLTFPQLYVDGLAQQYWVELEVTPGPLVATGGSAMPVNLPPVDVTGVNRVTPAAAYGAGAGTSPPGTPTVTGDDARGEVTFGSGTSPVAGVVVTITFTQPRDVNRPPVVVLSEATQATAGVDLAAVLTTAGGQITGFTINSNTRNLTASQANGTYGVNWVLAE